MSIAFNQIHNIVRTYQRMLHLPERQATTSLEPTDREDRVSISAEARELEGESHHHDKPRAPATGARNQGR